jgi:uncharacterized membrane protein (UPF0182 family)
MAIALTSVARPRPRDTPAQRVSLWRTPRARALLAAACAGLAGGAVLLVARVYTDLLWFHEVGHVQVLWTTLQWKLLAAAFPGLATMGAVLVNLAIAERVVGDRARGGRIGAALWQQRRIAGPLVAIGCGVLVLDLEPDGAWRLLLLWAHRRDFGAADPLFHRDVGFFVFSLPLYRATLGWLLQTVLMSAGAAAGVYAAAGRLRDARAHLLLLAALLCLLLRWRLHLEQYALALPHAGSPVPGASYTDVHVRLAVLRVRGVLTLLEAGLCLYGAVRVVRLAPLALIGALTLVAGAATSGLPGLVERFDVEPQALSRERPYVADAIASTRTAFALDRIVARPLADRGVLTRRVAADNRSTIENVPLWDSSVLRPALDELESIGGYYRFPSVSVDRYTVGGKPRVMTVAARERDVSRLPRKARSWANARFAYTHGYGVVAVEGGQADTDRYPRFAQRGFDARANALGLTQPRTYFGQALPGDPPYTVVASTRGEIEAPSPGSRSPQYHYDGHGGIELSNLLRRAAFAARFGDLKLALTETAVPRSRILMHRDVGDRVRTIAPFLQWDSHPQTVVADGRVQFLLRGFTTSRDYPYAARVPLGGERVNYVRSAAVAVVDGFDGRVRLYAADAADPLLDAWSAAYPGLFAPLAQMPPELRAHLRYPQRLFKAQAEAYSTYHALDPTGFWNGADAWERSRQLAGPVESAGNIRFPAPGGRSGGGAHAGGQPSRSRPAYMLGRLPGDRHARFVLTTSFSPHGRQNLVAYLAGWVDGRGAPHLEAVSLPRDRLTVGPTQATREILASPAVNQRLALLNRESNDLAKSSVSRTVLGAHRIVPVGKALIYVQPIYVIAGGSGVPRLQLVTAYANGRVGYGRDLAGALRRLIRDPSTPARRPARGP